MKNDILVIIPHASTKRPRELKKEWLTKNQEYLLRSGDAETDRYSELLYDFRRIIGNQQLLFPFSQVYINVCRHPQKLGEICPYEICGKKIYKKDISDQLREILVQKYATPFFDEIRNFKGSIILSGHTTISGHSSLEDINLPHQIIISNIIEKGSRTRKFAPDKLIRIYVEELRKRLPDISIGVNSVYVEVYDYICDRFGWQKGRKGTPIIHQETDESLYIIDNRLDLKKLKMLKTLFAEALVETDKRFKK